ncbi:MAG: hypothetical protein M1305_02620 [Candidatus Marsarchaeota archaeon]|nr:hypothetical protein [Candidatus Marsarchaeota archaeon]
MRRSIYRKADYLRAGQFFHWATKEHYITWLTGQEERHKRTEVMLPRLVSEGKLVARRHGNRLIYSVPRRMKRRPDIGHEIPQKYRVELEDRFYQVEHGLACTEALVRMWRSDMGGEVIAERCFRGMGTVPEWGIRYHSGSLLLYEYCTEDNFYRTSLVKNKVKRYCDHLEGINDRFAGNGTIVLFVLDVPRQTVESFIRNSRLVGEPFMFTDYDTFRSVPLGENLRAPIYIWAQDGETYSLVSHDTKLDFPQRSAVR